jgi:hypothetical protein
MADLNRSEGVESNISGLDGSSTEPRAGVTQSQELQVDDGPANDVLNGVATVVSAATAVSVMGGATQTRSLAIRAHRNNTGIIYVGSSTVAAANGYRLGRGQSVTLEIDNSADEVFVDASVDGDGVSFIALDKAT